MADVDPDHPVVKSMSAIYWRGGMNGLSAALSSAVFQPHHRWGGGSAIDNGIRYLSPGLQLVSFDPKNFYLDESDRRVSVSDRFIDDVAEAAAIDVSTFNQEAWSRQPLYLRRDDRAGVEKFCARLQQRLGVDRDYGIGRLSGSAVEMQEEIAALQLHGRGAGVGANQWPAWCC